MGKKKAVKLNRPLQAVLGRQAAHPPARPAKWKNVKTAGKRKGR